MTIMTKEEIRTIASKIYSTDWYYNYSDDYGVYERGRLQCENTRNTVKSYEWNDVNYNHLIESFFEMCLNYFRDGIIPDDFREAWTKRINSLTGR